MGGGVAATGPEVVFRSLAFLSLSLFLNIDMLHRLTARVLEPHRLKSTYLNPPLPSHSVCNDIPSCRTTTFECRDIYFKRIVGAVSTRDLLWHGFRKTYFIESQEGGEIEFLSPSPAYRNTRSVYS